MDANYTKRNSELLKVLKKNDIDSILIFSRENIRYLCGFSGSSGTLLYRPDSRIFFTDARYIEQAKNQVIDARVKLANRGIVDVCKYLNSDRISSIGIESSGISYQNFIGLKKKLRNIKIKPIFDELQNLRVVKDKKELQNIKRAIQIAEDALLQIIKLIKVGMTELELAIELEHRVKLCGSEELPFNVIVLFGKNTSLPHGSSGKNRLKKGDLILIDFGARREGYCSDETITFVFDRVNSEQKRIYNAVNDARKYAIDSIRSGTNAAEIDSVVRKYLEKKGLAKYFGHGLGHGVGLAIHESPRVSQDSTEVLEEGMVLTVEPGLYIPGWGGVRLEDMLAVEKKGAKILTGISKDLRIIEG